MATKSRVKKKKKKFLFSIVPFPKSDVSIAIGRNNYCWAKEQTNNKLSTRMMRIGGECFFFFFFFIYFVHVVDPYISIEMETAGILHSREHFKPFVHVYKKKKRTEVYAPKKRTMLRDFSSSIVYPAKRAITFSLQNDLSLDIVIWKKKKKNVRNFSTIFHKLQQK